MKWYFTTLGSGFIAGLFVGLGIMFILDGLIMTSNLVIEKEGTVKLGSNLYQCKEIKK